MGLPALELCADQILDIHIDYWLIFHYYVAEICGKAGNYIRAMVYLTGMLDLERKCIYYFKQHVLPTNIAHVQHNGL